MHWDQGLIELAAAIPWDTCVNPSERYSIEPETLNIVADQSGVGPDPGMTESRLWLRHLKGCPASRPASCLSKTWSGEVIWFGADIGCQVSRSL